MKFIMTNKNWTRVALCAMAISSYAHSSETSVNIIKATGSFIGKVERTLSQFFNVSSNVSYNECVTSLSNALTEIENRLHHLTENSTDTLSTKACEIAQEARKHFNAAYSVIKHYNGIIKKCKDEGKGNGSDHASKFIVDIQRVFSPEIAFNSISTKLHALHAEAEKEGHSELMHVIDQLALVIQKKKAEWFNKSDLALFAGLKVRMNK